MKTCTNLIFGIFLLLLCNQAAAKNHSFLGKKVLESIKQAKKQSILNSTIEVNDCVDLSGKWIGSCIDESGQSQEANIEIDQHRCQYLSLNRSLDLEAGGAYQYNDVSPTYFQDSAYFPQWNTEGTVFKLLYNSNSRQIGGDDFRTGHVWHFFQIINHKLEIQSKAEFTSYIGGQKSISRHSSKCSYDREVQD